MGNYNQDNRSGNRSGSRKYSGGGGRGRESGPREMHKAVCNQCGKNCEVPFKPSGDKPIYCSNCFEKRGGGSSQRSGRGDSGRSDYGKKDNTNKQILEQLISLNTKLDRILDVHEKTHDKKTAPKTAEVKKAKKAASKQKKPKVKKVSKKVTKSAS